MPIILNRLTEEEIAAIPNLFTPYVTGEEDRVVMRLSDEDHAKIGRGRNWGPVEVTDLFFGKKYLITPAPCSLEDCYCAAFAQEIYD